MSWVVVAALSGAIGVVAGAFGSHALRTRLAPEMASAWDTAVLYHLLHSAVLLAIAFYGVLGERPVRLPAGLFTAGIALFSGSLYLIALTGWRALGPVTPLGGLCLIAGWISLLTLARPTS